MAQAAEVSEATMEWSTTVFALVLILLSLAMLAFHWTAWRKSDHGGLSQRDQDFARRQFRRRTQASGMVGAIGLLMLTTQAVEERTMALALWLAILCGVGWLILTALIDWWSTRAFYGREEVVNAVQMELLKKEIRRFQEEQGK